MTLNFLLREMTHLRYFVPIIQEGNRRGLKSKLRIIPSNKYNCPLMFSELVNKVCKENNIEITEDMPEDFEGAFFCNENSGLDWTKRVKSEGRCKVVVTTYQTDFIACYKDYVDFADHILMPSKNIAKYYNRISDKNLYVGIPKYDVEIDKNEVIEKYGLDPNKKKVLILWPKSRDLHRFPIDIISNFNDLGWQVLVKARAKDPISKSTREALSAHGHKYFYDEWVPHTSQELLEVSDLVINSGSTVIEECVMHEVPLINFDIKPEVRHGRKQEYRVTHSYLYDYDFCINLKGLDSAFSTTKLSTMINTLLQKDLTSSFNKCRADWLYNHKNSCKKLLDVITS